MFDNIGGKIKGLAAVCTGLGMAASVIGGIIMMTISESMVLLGFLVIVIGCLGSWISSLCLYGFGEMIDKICKIEEKLQESQYAASNSPQAESLERRCAETSVTGDANSATQTTIHYDHVETTTAIMIGETNIQCANCRKIQFKGNKVCNRCGAKFV